MQTNLFLGQLKAKGKNVGWIVSEMNKSGVKISYSTFYKKLKGSSEFNAPEIKSIVKAMDYSKDEMYNIFFEELVS
ncbi:hypothetical protein [Brochothrix thermosphacta]|uniref:hypothetical protein n=1 Tax=Brochothrix thermosphacta TaxID=2756 RepID=UPI00083F61C4|nr:hypothetical protein [Brochothrix thermosphacta]ODJ54830.1 hypothetical protein BFR41_06925 [Brochothrix thermosphacta]ODJ63273.1 hypothetical protein BFR35_01450 [Brochothrix thermosphacta]ODJ66922.1 hypothetical protein BFR37_07320 [Brochothrix thermosphacta]